MTQPDAKPTTGRIAHRSENQLQPLYPPARLLNGNLLELNQAVESARNELAAAQGEIARLREEFAAEIGRCREELAVEAEAVRAKAHEEGCASGRIAFADLLSHAGHELDRMRDECSRSVEQLAFQIARKIVHTEFTVRPGAIVNVVAEVLDKAKFYQQITVVLHPDDLERVRERESDLIQRLIHCERLEFRADPLLPPHSVRLETNRGVLEKIIDEQFAQLFDRCFADAARSCVRPGGEGKQP